MNIFLDTFLTDGMISGVNGPSSTERELEVGNFLFTMLQCLQFLHEMGLCFNQLTKSGLD